MTEKCYTIPVTYIQMYYLRLQTVSIYKCLQVAREAKAKQDKTWKQKKIKVVQKILF